MTQAEIRKKHHLPGRIVRTVALLNGLVREAHAMGFLVQGILDTKQLPFPVLDLRLFKEARYEVKRKPSAQ